MPDVTPAETTPSHGATPNVSVVVPVYNVELYLDEALKSIRQQSERDIEIVCIDDGSTDSSPAILDIHAAEDDRVRVFRQDNSGLGSARNAGLRRCRGRYIQFVDSDDLLPDNALRNMVATLDRTNSDFATGKIRRFDDTRQWRSAFSTKAYNFRIDATSVRETPLLIKDISSCNKLFKRTYLESIQLSFPEGVAFEDIVPMMEAHLKAEAVDIVPSWVYEWRDRSDSISNTRTNWHAFADRILALEEARSLAEQLGGPTVLAALLNKLVTFDQMIYVRAIDPYDADHLGQFVAGYQTLFRQWQPHEFLELGDTTPVQIAQAVRAGDLERVRGLIAAYGGMLTPKALKDSFVAAPKQARLTIQARLRRARKRRWKTLKTWAAPYQKEAEPYGLKIAGTVVGAATKPKPLRRFRRYTGNPIASVRRWARTKLLVRGRRNATINSGTGDIKGLRVLTRYTEDGWLKIRAHRAHFMIAPKRLDGDGAIVDVEHSDSVEDVQLYAAGSGRIVPGQMLSEGEYFFDTSRVLVGPEPTWVVRYRRAGSWQTADGVFDAPSLRHQDALATLTLATSPQGRVELRRRLTRPNVDVTTLTDHRFRIAPHPGISAVRVRNRKLKVDLAMERADDGGWHLDLEDQRPFGEKAPLRVGVWDVSGYVGDRWKPLTTDASVIREIPDSGAGTILAVKFDSQSMTIRVRADYSVEERGKWNQSALASTVPRSASSSALKSQVVYECYYGRQVSCHPRPMHEMLAQPLSDWDHIWVVNPGRTYAPAGTRPVIRWTREWYEVMAESQVVISNCGTSPHFRRREDQVMFQTWHGTPLKRIGLDMLTFDQFRGGYRRETELQSQQWTHLVSPSPYCSEIFPRAFGYSGRLLEIGSPRNDSLVHNDPERVARVRSAVGLKNDQRAVLVAPTWRDNVKRGGGWHAGFGFDPARLLESLPEDVVVLFRAHSNIVSLDDFESSSRFINVSDYPDIQDLYLISEVLSTDFSSVMFDFAVLNRPIVFFAPDLELYRDETRGMYFDFPHAAPGPITSTPEEFYDAMATVLADGMKSSELEKMDQFRHRFNGLEDGNATRRATDAILEWLG